MIALGETDPTSAEVPFFLPMAASPLLGLAGHVFALGEVTLALPGGGPFSAATSQIVEKGFGRYCVRLAPSQCAVGGNVYVRAVVTGAQPYTGVEEIGTAGGDMYEGIGGRVPFNLPNSTDPIFGSPLTGHTFTLGEVQVCLPRTGYVNALLGNIFEIGFGAYELAIPAASALRGKVFVFAQVTGAQRFEGFATILNVGSGPTPIPPTPPGPTPVPVPPQLAAAAFVDHVASALGRIPMQWRS